MKLEKLNICGIAATLLLLEVGDVEHDDFVVASGGFAASAIDQKEVTGDDPAAVALRSLPDGEKVVIVADGIARQLDKDELRAVLSHECGHLATVDFLNIDCTKCVVGSESGQVVYVDAQCEIDADMWAVYTAGNAPEVLWRALNKSVRIVADKMAVCPAQADIIMKTVMADPVMVARKAALGV